MKNFETYIKRQEQLESLLESHPSFLDQLSEQQAADLSEVYLPALGSLETYLEHWENILARDPALATRADLTLSRILQNGGSATPSEA